MAICECAYGVPKSCIVLTTVTSFDEVPKAEKDCPPPAFQPLVPKPGVIPYNSRLQKTMLPGREEEAQELLKVVKGKKPKVGHMPRLEVPRRFYMQLDQEDLHMLLISRAFHASLKV